VLFVLFLLLYGIISAILRGTGKRRGEIPVGTYEQIGPTNAAAAAMPEETAVTEAAPLSEETAVTEAAPLSEETAVTETAPLSEEMAAEETEVLPEETEDGEEEEKTEDLTGIQTAGAEEEAEETGTEE
jgi:pyocin large subunit-like protein